MANERQGAVVQGTRGVAARLDEDVNDLEDLLSRYDVLNLETPNFANGYFGSTQEITADDLLGVFNSLNALKSAAASEWAAFRAAMRKARG